MPTSVDIDDDEVRRRYAAGESLRDLATSYGVAISAIVARLPERRRVGRPARPDVDTAEIVRLRDEEGLTLHEIARRFDINKSTVLRRYNATLEEKS